MAIDRKACFQRQLLDISNATDELDERVTALEESPGQTYTAGAGIEIDSNNAISVDARVVPFKIDLATVAFSGDYNDLTDKPDIPDMTDYVTKTIENEDTQYGINYGLSNNTPQLFGADDSGNHPCDAMVRVTYDSVHINANDYNHGDDDDTYTGSIDVTDGYVDIEATDGTDTTTLRVAPSGVTVNGSPIGGGSTLYRHHVQIFKANSSTYNCECIIFADIINDSNTEITSLATILSILDAGVSTGYMAKGILASGVVKDGSNFRTIIELRVIQPSTTILQGLYIDTSNVYALSRLIDIPSDAEVTDRVFTF